MRINCPRSVQFSPSTMSNSLRPHGLQHATLPGPSPFPRTCSNSCPLSQWCHPTISYSVIPFSSWLRSFPASGSSPVRWPKYWSFSFSIRPSNEYSGLIAFKIGWFDLLAVQKTLKSPLQHHSSKVSILLTSIYYYGKTIALFRQIFFDKVISLLCNMLSTLIIAFLPRSNCL